MVIVAPSPFSPSYLVYYCRGMGCPAGSTLSEEIDFIFIRCDSIIYLTRGVY